MENFSLETLIESLIVLGFEEVDSMLLILTLGKITIDQQDRYPKYKFREQSFSKQFTDVIDTKDNYFKLKDGLTLSSNISPSPKFNYSISDFLTSSSKKNDFIDYLSTIDFEEIVARKVVLLGDNKQSHFCNKEREILSKNRKVNVIKS